MSLFSMSMMAIFSRPDETSDRSEIQSKEPWELLSYHRSKLRRRGSLGYSNIGANYYYHWYW
jgi:hypothetical protein